MSTVRDDRLATYVEPTAAKGSLQPSITERNVDDPDIVTVCNDASVATD
jgi:hypothetical protein